MKSERNRECIGAAHAGLWCAVFFLLLGSHQVRAQSAVGVVSEIAGTARIARGGANLTVSKGTAVLPWDKLKAEAQSSLTITLNNGGNIALEGPLEFLVNVSDSLEPATSIPAGLLRKNSGHTGASTFKASAMGLRAERTRLAFDSFGAIGGLHPRRVRERVGSVLKVNGTTHVTKAASITLVHEGTPIDAGDVLTTDTGASLTLVISDQSAIDLGDRTQLVAGARTDIPGAAQEEVDRSSFFLKAGSACFKVSKRLPQSPQFLRVFTSNAQVAANAGKLAITHSDRSSTYDGSSTGLAVAQGAAAIFNPNESEKSLEWPPVTKPTYAGLSRRHHRYARSRPNPVGHSPHQERSLWLGGFEKI
ncbi:MAG TPA: FecR domain-containing protein [Candidatus Binataceae bacterium]|jgi:hypothetical protein|nr:FecR domain-containing protein [Candidatus Binataceae bacterium]